MGVVRNEILEYLGQALIWILQLLEHINQEQVTLL